MIIMSFLESLSHKNKSFKVSKYIFVLFAFMCISIFIVLLYKNNKIATFSVKGKPTTTVIAGKNNFNYTGTDGISNLYSVSNISPNNSIFQNNQISAATILNNM
jgi:hypothetical protein